MASYSLEAPEINILFPVLPLRDLSLFPEASLGMVIGRSQMLHAVEMASRSGGRLMVVAQDASATGTGSIGLHTLGTVAQLAEDLPVSDGGHRIELDGLWRARVVSFVGAETVVAEVQRVEEGDPGDEWGPAVEALARYLHAHPDLRSFLDQQRRSKEPMAWVNLACQHLPIAASARQKLLESDAEARCLKISRGLDALLRKEKGD